MSAQRAFYRPGAAWSRVPAGLPLVALLSGYRDAGATVQLATEAILAHDEGELVAEFDVDAVFDYRARRPVVRFESNRVVEYRAPRLDLRLVTDSFEQPFLLLSGFEPDFHWRGFTDAVLELIDHFQVRATTWSHSVPMPVPHTRPVRCAVTGTRADYIAAHSVWQTSVEAPAHVLHELEYRLGERGADVVDLVLLVPHYLTDASFPAAARKLLEMVGSATGRMVTSDALRERDRRMRSELDAQIEDHDEMLRLIQALETQYDGVVGGSSQENPFADADGELPSADDIAAELEAYLSARRRSQDS